MSLFFNYSSYCSGFGKQFRPWDVRQRKLKAPEPRPLYNRPGIRVADDVVLVEGDPILANPYGVIPVNPELHPNVNAELAQLFVDWLISVETQQLIADYQVNGQQLFFASSEPYLESIDSE